MIRRSDSKLEHGAQGGRPVCGQVLDQRGGDPFIARLIVIIVPGLMLFVAARLENMHSFLVLGPRGFRRTFR
jgi:hypothetical protein